ncbi:MAG: hypothetical protein WEA59_05010 [Ferruginibacter sp.]
MKLFLILFFSCCLQISTHAQSDKPTYRTGIGMRFTPFGVSFKANSLRTARSTEFIGYFKDGFIASALMYWNYTLNDAKNIKLYGGGGLQGGWKDKNNGNAGVFGVTGIIGVDYKFLQLPLNISLDWQPAYQFFSGESDFQPNYGGIAVRFTL